MSCQVAAVTLASCAERLVAQRGGGTPHVGQIKQSFAAVTGEERCVCIHAHFCRPLCRIPNLCGLQYVSRDSARVQISLEAVPALTGVATREWLEEISAGDCKLFVANRPAVA